NLSVPGTFFKLNRYRRQYYFGLAHLDLSQIITLHRVEKNRDNFSMFKIHFPIIISPPGSGEMYQIRIVGEPILLIEWFLFLTLHRVFICLHIRVGNSGAILVY
ncbi:hypothetical protein ACJX0J_007337, partial [Zea mays]